MINAYGAKTVLERYIGSSINRVAGKTKINWQHGWQPQQFNSDLDMVATEATGVSDAETEVYLVGRQDQEFALKESGLEYAAAFGLPFAYALAQNTSKPEARIRNSLLVVPAGHGFETERDRDWQVDRELLEELQPFTEQVSRKSVMVFGDDLLDGRGAVWLKAGFEVIEGARYEDSTSLDRVARIFRSFDFVTTNDFGSHIAYASAAGCRVSIFGPRIPFVDSAQWSSMHRHRPDLRGKSLLAVEAAMEHLRELGFFVEPLLARDRKEWGLAQIGFDEVRSSSETADLLRALSRRANHDGRSAEKQGGLSRASKTPEKASETLRLSSTNFSGKRAWNPGLVIPNLVSLGKPGPPELRKLRVAGSPSPLYFRRLTSDRKFMVRNLCAQPLSHIVLKDPKLILDLGSYAGFSTRALVEAYPDAQVFGIDAVEENCVLAKKNLTNFANASILHSALSTGEERLALLQPEPDDWSFTTTERLGGLKTVPALTLVDFFNLVGGNFIDLLKVDLQGFEYQILLANLDLVVERCGTLALTFHHRRARQTEFKQIHKGLMSHRFEASELENSFVIYQRSRRVC